MPYVVFNNKTKRIVKIFGPSPDDFKRAKNYCDASIESVMWAAPGKKVDDKI